MAFNLFFAMFQGMARFLNDVSPRRGLGHAVQVLLMHRGVDPNR